ncbi:YqhG family protein [Bacillus alkalicellulosilyticus]|uniref:YqhG family protein n=1 Tax=Alkalihalobacterium alkalicellulosilyticum TaxID=1912214 RepID=UPI000996CEB0|nr:YqhG family protein [Bacillus alkalicellulosilyticus]
MQQHQIHNYLERYFVANNSPILEKTAGHMEVQLSIELDKALMNRPFYWHYLEKTGGEPNPMKMTLITDQDKAPEDIKGELIHFGAPRLYQIFQSTTELGGFIRLYEKVVSRERQMTPLHPWLCLNTKISFQCDRKKDVIISLGLNLINGQIIPQFFDSLVKSDLTPKIPDFCFTLSPLITPKSGLLRLEKVIRTFIEEQDHTWAVEAHQRWEADLKLLNRFYEDVEEVPESYENEKEALGSQYAPKVVVKVINGGMFYLKP